MRDERLEYAEAARQAAEQRATALQAEAARLRGELEGMTRAQQTAADAFAESAKECDALRKIVAKLPKTADGVPVVPGMTVWAIDDGDGEPYEHKITSIYPVNGDVLIANRDNEWAPIDCYSTREAAATAKEER